MKTIVIRPEVIAYHNSSLREPQRPINRPLAACFVLLPLVALGSWLAGRSTAPHPNAASTPAAQLIRATPTAPVAAPEVLSTDGVLELQGAVDRGLVKASFSGNGREHLDAQLSNPGTEPQTIRISFGQTFESGANAVVAARGAQVKVAAGQTLSLPVVTTALRSANRVANAHYQLSARTAPKIDLLLTYAQDHPGLTPAALQTAVLALTENLPLNFVCKFAPAGGDLPSHFDTSAFRVEIPDLLTALSTLREIGIRDGDLAMTIDPQLKIEAMIDPACRAAAMRYYKIESGAEWEYWKKELLNGDIGTRHYALFGIARFYPEVALEMLPKWAREKRTTQIFRLTAVQALGETKRVEALPVLSDLVNELGRNTELGRAAFQAVQILDATLRQSPAKEPTVAFRGSMKVAF